MSGRHCQAQAKNYSSQLLVCAPRTPTAKQGSFCACPSTFGRQSSCLQNAPYSFAYVWQLFLALLCVLVFPGETTYRRASRLAASIRSRSTPAMAHGPPAMACDDLLYVSAHISPLAAEQAETPQSVFAHWRSAEAWYRDDPSLLRWPCGHTRNFVRSPGPVLDATLPSSHLCFV